MLAPHLADEFSVVLLLDDLLLLLSVPHACADHPGDVDRVLHLANLINLKGAAHIKVGVAAVAVQALQKGRTVRYKGEGEGQISRGEHTR